MAAIMTACPECESGNISNASVRSRAGVRELELLCADCGVVFYTPTKAFR